MASCPCRPSTSPNIFSESYSRCSYSSGYALGEKVTVYWVTGERIHFGAVVTYSPLHLLIRPDERAMQTYITW